MHIFNILASPSRWTGLIESYLLQSPEERGFPTMSIRDPFQGPGFVCTISFNPLEIGT